jgi:RNA polymerase sigma-70 factor (sigma-E family)
MKLAWSADIGAAPSAGDDAASTPRTAPTEPAGATSAVSNRDDGLRRLYEQRHAEMVRFAAFLTGDVDAAEDLAQDAFAKVFDAWDRVEDPERIDAYLKATVVNLVRGGHRRQQTRERHRSDDPGIVPSAEEAALTRAGRDRVLAAVSALPLRQRACVVMRHWMRMTESEIADTLELSIGSVRTHVRRGTASLRNSLGDLR